MFTIFTCPKPFIGHIGLIQRNAIRSWCELHPKCQIVLLGRDDGVSEIAAEFGLDHVAEIACNEFGTPLVSDYFKTAERVALYEVLCYINTDVILMNDMMEAVCSVSERFEQFMLVGRRWNLRIENDLDIREGWQSKLRDRARREGMLAPPVTIEVFAFRRGTLGEIPPFAVGRTRYDNWLLFRAIELGFQTVDCTPMTTCVHQDHTRTFSSMGKEVRGGHNNLRKGEEARRNHELAGGWDHIFTTDDAAWRLTAAGLTRSWCGGDSDRCLEVLRAVRPDNAWIKSHIMGRIIQCWCEFRLRLELFHREKRLSPLVRYLPWAFVTVLGMRGSGNEH